MGVGRCDQRIPAAPVAAGIATARTRNSILAGMVMQEKKADVFVAATVTSNTEACEGMRKLVIKVDSGIAASYKVPGQYTKARSDSSQEKPGFYAFCSAPGAIADSFEFLIKRTPANDWGPGSGWICDLKEGASLELTDANGGGYKYAALSEDVSDVLLFATGSGVAPLKAVLESGDLKGKNVKLYYGCRNADTMPYQELFASWNCEVIPTLSQPGADWSGRKGYIQDALKSDGIAKPTKTAALLCGVKGMTEGVKEVLKEAGVPDCNVLFNF